MLNVGMCSRWRRIYRLIRCYCAAYSHCRCLCSFFIWISHKIIICLNIRSSRFRTYGNTFFCRTSSIPLLASDRFITVYHFGYERIGPPQRHDNWFSVFLLFAFHGCNRFMFRKTLTHTHAQTERNRLKWDRAMCWMSVSLLDQGRDNGTNVIATKTIDAFAVRTHEQRELEGEWETASITRLDKGDMMTALSVCKVEWMCEICPC